MFMQLRQSLRPSTATAAVFVAGNALTQHCQKSERETERSLTQGFCYTLFSIYFGSLFALLIVKDGN